jgi:hypothetical protein
LLRHVSDVRERDRHRRDRHLARRAAPPRGRLTGRVLPTKVIAAMWRFFVVYPLSAAIAR